MVCFLHFAKQEIWTFPADFWSRTSSFIYSHNHQMNGLYNSNAVETLLWKRLVVLYMNFRIDVLGNIRVCDNDAAGSLWLLRTCDVFCVTTV